MATITDGKSAGCRAVGVGGNVKKLRKAVRLAMAVTLQIFEGAAVVQELQHVVVQARLALALAGSNQLLAAPGEAVAIPEASCPATVVTKSSATVNNSVDVKSIVVVAPASGKPNGRVDPSAPRERLEDPIHRTTCLDRGTDCGTSDSLAILYALQLLDRHRAPKWQTAPKGFGRLRRKQPN